MFEDIIKSNNMNNNECHNLLKEARSYMWKELCSDEALWIAYQSNIAMYLQDNACMEHELSNAVAKDLMELIFS